MTTYQDIQQQVGQVIQFSQGFTPSDTQLTKMMETWQTNKQKYIDWFSGKLIFEYGKVEFHLDKERKQDLIKEFLEQAGNYLLDDEFSELSNFILKNMSSFFDNIVSCDANPAKKGMKLSKAFKYFISNKDTLNKVQQIASMYIQKDKISGTLCLSVHPLDYLSLSENNYNWRSCHSLDGDYKAGNLSYMCDASTIVCYIKGDNDEEILPHFPDTVKWNSKKWRMLIYFDENKDYCFLGRQYPYALEDVLDIIETFLPAGQYAGFTDYSVTKTPIANVRKYIVLNTKERGWDLVPIDEVIEDCRNPLHFNDLLYSSVYSPYYTSKAAPWDIKSKFPKIHVGHTINCLYCGDHSIDAGEKLMLCTDCAAALGVDLPDGYVYCTDCGEPILEDNAYYTAYGDIICEDCLNNGDWVTCSECGEIYYYDDIYYSEKYDADFCKHCFEEIKEEEYAYRRAHRSEEEYYG